MSQAFVTFEERLVDSRMGEDGPRIKTPARFAGLFSRMSEDGPRIKIPARLAGLFSRMNEAGSRIEISAEFAAGSVTIEFGR